MRRGESKGAAPRMPDGPFRNLEAGGCRPRDDYIAFVVIVFDDIEFDIIMFESIEFDIIMSLPMAPSTAVMLSVIVPSIVESVTFRSVTTVFSVVFSVEPPQAETSSAAPAIIEAVRPLARMERIWKLPR